MFEKFSERSRRIVALAQEESEQAAHGWIGTEHFVLALTDEPEHDWTARFLGEA